VSHLPRNTAPARGFTLIEVLVALVIVAFGVGAVLAALSSSALNVSALREKTLAQWVALNRVADTRLNLQAPQTGTTEGDVKNFANGDWHWQQIVTAMEQIPGLMQITVKVRRLPTSPGSSSGSNSAKTITYSSTPTISGSTSSSSSSGAGSASGGDWITTVIGFRGDALATASGETPTWAGTPAAGSSSSSSGAAVTSGTVPNPGTTGTTGTPANTTPTTGTPAVPGSSSSGGP
jgi:general secretion pathway protein I